MNVIEERLEIISVNADDKEKITRMLRKELIDMESRYNI